MLYATLNQTNQTIELFGTMCVQKIKESRSTRFKRIIALCYVLLRM